MDERTYPQGVTCWIDTVQQDVDAALTFYGGLFGWTFTDATPPDAPDRYVVARLGGRDVAAVAGPGAGSAPDPRAPSPRWRTYVAVDDVDTTSARAAELGASVTAAPAEAGPGGRTSSLTDPEGAAVHLWQARRRLGAQAVNEPGAWNFSDLHTTDPARAQEFYGSLLGWRFADLGFATTIMVPGYGDHLEATVDPDIRTRQASAPEGFADVIGALVPLTQPEAPSWQVTVTVADRDDTAALAERLGARVEATSETDWTRTARLRDPQGALLTVSQFTPPDDWA